MLNYCEFTTFRLLWRPVANVLSGEVDNNKQIYGDSYAQLDCLIGGSNIAEFSIHCIKAFNSYLLDIGISMSNLKGKLLNSMIE